VGRTPKRNKPATTTISISVELRERIHQNKWRGVTCDEFLDKVVSEWLDHKENSQILKLTNELLEKRIEEYDQTLTELKSIGNVQTIEELKSKLYYIQDESERAIPIRN
jgi:hypothetical protein